LEWAAQQGRTIFTFNGGDYAAIHTRWLQQGKHHAGIIVSAQRTRGDLLRRIRQLAAVLDANAMQDRLEYLGNW